LDCSFKAAESRDEVAEMQPSHSKTIFFVGLILAASGVVSPAVALAGGIAFGFTVEHPFRLESHSLAKLLLQASVVALGFGMNLKQVVHAGRSGFFYTAISISAAMLLGLLFGSLLKVAGKASFLISAGTAICGGSAIAAISPITGADEQEISVSMGTIFLLNSVALIIFPVIGHALHLSQNQFGLWSALAIHDTSSVVGAAAKYGNQALVVGTTVKLAYMARSAGSGSRARVKVPWFIFLFCVAAAASTYLPRFAAQYGALNHLGKAGLTATLFLIGTSLSKDTLRQVGVRPFLQGVTLWIIVAGASLAAIYCNCISI
jgi:uncharacterized integral membrane protein (TIGR00698 family)